MPNYLAALPQFLSTFLLAMLLLSVFWSIYTYLTSHDEIALLRQGNISTAIGLSGALAGFALPVCAAIFDSVSYGALIQWALVAMAIQIAIYVLIRLLLPELHDAINEDRPATSVLLAALSVIGGLLNATVIIAI